MITAYLEDLERRIDAAGEDRLLAECRSFCDGRFAGGIFSPKRENTAPPVLAWPAVRVNAALDDFDQMALQQFAACSSALEQGSDGLLCVRCNYGTSILPSLFGVELFRMADELNTLPTSRPLAGGVEAIKTVLDKGIPDIHQSLGGQALEMGERFVEMMQPYPQVARYVQIYHPDTQGPMDICELLWGSELFVDIFDEPELVHQLLTLVTETYINYMRAWQRIVPPLEGYAVHWGMLHRGQIMLRDDSAMNFSPAMFDEFIKPYDQRLLQEFGGGALHFCGRGDHYIASASTMPGLYAINLSQPEYNDMSSIFAHTIDKGIAILGLDRGVAEETLAAGRNLHGLVHCR